MTSWILTHSTRFACAIPEMLVSNLLSMWGTSDIGWYLMEAEAGGSPLDGGRGLWAHSPLAHAAGARTPTMVIEGEADHRCPIGQGEELYTALRRQGVEAVLVRLQGASHIAAWTGPPRQRLARKILIDRFLGRHGVGGDAARGQGAPGGLRGGRGR
jgi:dipeptidyl aminopeptidase/acylaminoacyl peptidase